MRHVLFLALLFTACAHQQEFPGIETSMPVYPAYAQREAGVDLRSSEIRAASYRACAAVPVTSRILATSRGMFGHDAGFDAGFWRETIFVSIAGEPILVTGHPLYDSETGLVFVPSPRALAPAVPRSIQIAEDEKIVLQGFVFKGEGASLNKPLDVNLIRRSPTIHPQDPEMCGAGVYDVDGIFLGIMAEDDKGHNRFVPVATVLAALKRVSPPH